MIRIFRRYDAKSVPAGFRGAGRIAKQRLILDPLRAGAKPEDLVWDSKKWTSAKPALKRETSGKCAYCEAPAGGRSKNDEEKGGLVAHCDVEHFRPKAIYWWLAHNFENYVYSCQICNQSFKSDLFPADNPLAAPITVTGGETDSELDGFADLMAPDPLSTKQRETWEKLILAEDAHLPDPLHEDPARLFKYVAEQTLGEVSMVPSASSGRDQVRAASTIKVLGLNREELRFARYDVYRTVQVLKDVLADSGIAPKTRDMVTGELSRLMLSDKPFAGMVRHFVTDVWKLGIIPAAPSAPK